MRLGILCGMLLLLGSGNTLAASPAPFKLAMAMPENEAQKLREFIKDKNLLDRFSYASPLLDSEQVMEGVLVLRALALAGLPAELQISNAPNTARGREMVKNGEVVIQGSTDWSTWADEFKDRVYKSSLIIPNGQFQKGFYTTPEKAASIKIKTAKDLATLQVVSNSNWVVDWATLQKFKLKSLSSTASRTSMFNMIAHGHGDCTVQTFSSRPDLAITDGGVTLFPVKGVKVALSGTRYFMVSRIHPDGKKVYEALEKGLAIMMKKDDEVQRALRESGFLNNAIRDWVLITAD